MGHNEVRKNSREHRVLGCTVAVLVSLCLKTIQNFSLFKIRIEKLPLNMILRVPGILI